METVIKFISQPWLGTLLGIAGLGAAVFFYLRSRKVTNLTCQHDYVSLLSDGNAAFPKEIEIRFSGTPVNRVTAERIILWNGGNTTIEGQQVVASDPLRIQLSEGQILRVDMLKATREVNAFHLVPRKGCLNIADVMFDYLDPGDGASFQVLHSGGQSDLGIRGTLRGIPSGITYFERAPLFLDHSGGQSAVPFWSSRLMMLLVPFIVGLSTMAYGLLRPYLTSWFPSLAQQPKQVDMSQPPWILVIGGALYMAMPIFFIWLRRRRYPSSLDTKEIKQAACGTQAKQD